ncbi:MAG: D-aminoacyl-tRNA deacylase [Candidatus Thermoplasmatota archaeon]|nr:D-aminoacyl-tRNA deacylase [Candidatus Thermoplasmatota archaeon]
MTTVIVTSDQDPASTNMRSCILQESSWVEHTFFLDSISYRHQHIDHLYMVTIPDKTIIHENLQEELNSYLDLEPTRLIFLSRHRSKTGEPTITTHPIGNYGTADFGGRPRSLTPALPFEMAGLLRILLRRAKEADLTHHICYEVTHHGPFLKIPTLFAEVGSDEKQWENIDACRVVALSVLELLENESRSSRPYYNDTVLLGIGGGHYAPRFSDMCLSKHAAFGHMIPSYHITSGAIDEEMLKRALDATPQVQGVYLHRKAMKKSDVTFFKDLCKKLGVTVLSSRDLLDPLK